MILRPVRPASPIGPPISKRPVGLTSRRKPSVSIVEAVELGRDDELRDVRREQRREVDVGGVLRRHDDGVEADGLVVLVVLDGDLGLAVGAEVRDRAVLADLRQPAREVVREVDRQRHQLGGVVARVAEHEALVAGALTVELVGRASPRAPRWRRRRPARCRGSASRSRPRRRTRRRRSPSCSSRSRSRGSSRARGSGCRPSRRS